MPTVALIAGWDLTVPRCREGNRLKRASSYWGRMVPLGACMGPEDTKGMGRITDYPF